MSRPVTPRVELTPQGANLTDLGSSNGTYLNGRTIEGGGSIPAEGDRVRVGSVAGARSFAPRVRSSPAPAPPPRLRRRPRRPRWTAVRPSYSLAANGEAAGEP